MQVCSIELHTKIPKRILPRGVIDNLAQDHGVPDWVKYHIDTRALLIERTKLVRLVAIEDYLNLSVLPGIGLTATLWIVTRGAKEGLSELGRLE